MENTFNYPPLFSLSSSFWFLGVHKQVKELGRLQVVKLEGSYLIILDNYIKMSEMYISEYGLHRGLILCSFTCDLS